MFKNETEEVGSEVRLPLEVLVVGNIAVTVLIAERAMRARSATAVYR